MSEEPLNQLRDVLSAMPRDEVSRPRLPMANALQEANDLLTLIGDEAVWGKLRAVGVDSEARERLKLALGAARAAQSQWVVVRDRQKSEPQQQREARGQALRLEILAAARWNLRDDRVALGTLSAIDTGESQADLIQDLNDLAELLDRKRAAFERDQTFDASVRAEEARSLAAELSAGTSAERLDLTQQEAVDMRDRAYSHMDSLVDAIREAGRYVYREQEDMAKRFASRYFRRTRRQPQGDLTTDVPAISPASA